MPRQPNGRPSVYLGADGWYHCYVTVGHKPGGKLDRRHLRGKTQAEVVEKIERLQATMRAGRVPDVGQSPTVGDWLEHWVTVITPRRVRPSTLATYESYVRTRIIPAIGHHRLAKLKPEHIEGFYAELERKVSSATALQIHRILSRALKVAVQRGKLTRNPCGPEFVDAPSHTRQEVQPLTKAETSAVLEAVGRLDRNAARWWVALALGLRQGEALGLRWSDVELDTDAPLLWVRKPLGRRKWRHGCADPVACAVRKCKTKPCGEGCNRHQRACPPPCRPGCIRHASSCPQRHGGGLVFDDPKSAKGRRPVPLAATIVGILREHRRQQARERLAVGPWTAHDLVFCRPGGTPIDPRADWAQWKELLADAGVSDHRLHDARHSAATLMFELGMEPREVQEILGHAQVSLTMGTYTHIRAEVMKRMARQMDAGLELLQPRRATKKDLA